VPYEANAIGDRSEIPKFFPMKSGEAWRLTSVSMFAS
jgi:hypothetical protein